MAAYKDKNGKWYISVYYTNWQGKGRFGFKLTPPYSQERKRAASRLAKNNIENLRRTTK